MEGKCMNNKANPAINRAALRPVKTAIMGCGQISGIYLQNLKGSFSKWVEVIALGDTVRERAEKRALEFNIPHVMDPEDIYSDDSIEMIVCLTNPPGHYYVLGDNRGNSEDSRFKDVGFVPLDLIKGKGIAVFWPLSEVRALP